MAEISGWQMDYGLSARAGQTFQWQQLHDRFTTIGTPSRGMSQQREKAPSSVQYKEVKH
ncbi:hypothetical protein V1282_000766 [Nitrobacteraceae bacterium AZCC 2146]